jgi:uncharacterized integral membrane protein
MRMNDPDKSPVRSRDSKEIPWPIVSFLAFCVVVGVFVLQNRDRMPVNFLNFEINSRQWVNLIVAVVLGVCLDRLFIGWRRLRRKDD